LVRNLGGVLRKRREDSYQGVLCSISIKIAGTTATKTMTLALGVVPDCAVERAGWTLEDVMAYLGAMDSTVV